MSGLGEQIAVLDGLDALDPTDGRIGQQRAAVTQYARAVMPGVLARKNVLDASAGANYSGGSSYAQGLPLLPSSVGLAGIPSVLPGKRNVIDPSGGANYTGGSDWVPGLPLVVSSAGLADALITGGYGRAGLGASFIDGGYGRAGLGQTGSAADEDLAAASEAVATARAINPEDGRVGQHRAQVDEYGRQVMPGVLARSNVLDASEGGNYSGGSSYAPGLPLLPSSIGLAGLELGAYDDLDAVPDKLLALPAAAKKIVGQRAVKNLKRDGQALAKRMARMTPAQRAVAAAKLRTMGNRLAKARQMRRQIAQQPPQQRVQAAAAKLMATRRPQQLVQAAAAKLLAMKAAQQPYAQRLPLWAR
jgi:hypothetical protein